MCRQLQLLPPKFIINKLTLNINYYCTFIVDFNLTNILFCCTFFTAQWKHICPQKIEVLVFYCWYIYIYIYISPLLLLLLCKYWHYFWFFIAIRICFDRFPLIYHCVCEVCLLLLILGTRKMKIGIMSLCCWWCNFANTASATIIMQILLGERNKIPHNNDPMLTLLLISYWKQ